MKSVGEKKKKKLFSQGKKKYKQKRIPVAFFLVELHLILVSILFGDSLKFQNQNLFELHLTETELVQSGFCLLSTTLTSFNHLIKARGKGVDGKINLTP